MTPAELLLSLVLTGVQSHYQFPSVLDDKRLEHLLLAGKQILYKSHQESDVRQALGFSPKVWSGLTAVFGAAIPVLEGKSFARLQNTSQNGVENGDGGAVTSNSSSDLIAANYLSLVKDIERLNDLCTVARNLLATTKRAQNLAAEKGFDQQVLRLIDVCVKVTARGFDGEGGNVRSEERWGKVVNLYKRLLITCLQFLHNFIMHNEQRKLVLWLDLFGNANASQQQQQQQLQGRGNEVGVEVTINSGVGDISSSQQQRQLPDRAEDAAVQERVRMAVEKLTRAVQGDGKPGEVAAELGYNLDDVHALFETMSTADGPDAKTQGTAKVLMEKIRSDMERLSGLDSTQLNGNPEALLKVGATLRAQMPNKELPLPVEQAVRQAAMHIHGDGKPSHGIPNLTSYTADISGSNQEISPEDLEMPRTAQSAADTLQEAKDELMARLQEPPSHIDENGELYIDDVTASGIIDDDLESGEEISEEEEEDDEEEDDEDDASSYRPSGDQERGLLTDVPLVLGPTEIEALPMIIQAGIVDNFGGNTRNTPPHTAQERQNIRNMQSVRCHILLAQEAGRNVLRELLIFIAAWDLPDDEFYFKMMVQIMEAILKNGLMSHAYGDFGQAKDIISPAQAVVVKILTHIYRGRYSPASAQADKNKSSGPVDTTIRTLKPPSPLIRVDVLTVRYIFTVFRGNIVPETCALIYLQGQIRQGLALAEDFPLNLWDMERVYEGVYQFLEFFAVLTENNDWKRLLVDWEIVYDLVTLIKELEAAIPKVNPLTAPKPREGERDVGAVYTGEAAEMAPPPPPPPAVPPPPSSLDLPTPTSNAGPVAVERPYSLSPSPPPPPPSANPLLATDLSTNPPPHLPPTKPSQTPPLAPPSQPQTPPPEDPSTFEWRNLKKLIILVLSSLVWKSKNVQDQIREHGGVDVVLNCTVHDANNPYIREHAVMCLKFLLEGNVENQTLVAELEKRGVVGAYKDEEGGFKGGAFGQGVVGGGSGRQGALSIEKGQKGKSRVQGEGASTAEIVDVDADADADGADTLTAKVDAATPPPAATVAAVPAATASMPGSAPGTKRPQVIMDESVFEDVD